MKERAKLADLYEENLQAQKEWLGYFEDITPYADPDFLLNMPKTVHVLDEAVLQRELESAGFHVLECVSYSPLGQPDTVRAGKYECTLAIAEKATS